MMQLFRPSDDTTLKSVDVEVDWSPPFLDSSLHPDLSPSTAILTSALHHAAISLDNTTVSQNYAPI